MYNYCGHKWCAGGTSTVMIPPVKRRLVDLAQDLGRNLRASRIAAGLTQEDLAALANVALSSLKSLEAGRGSTVATLLKVLRALDSADWVDQLAPPPKPFSPLDALAEQQAAAARRPIGPPRARKRTR